MKKTLLILILIISNTIFSQSIWKKEADLKKANGIKETSIYIQSSNDENQQTLWDWKLFDKKGRVVESKRFLDNGKIKTHYKFKYPTNKTRILISLNKRGKEIERINQNFDLSGEEEPLKEFNDNKSFRYEYNEAGNITKVWRIKQNPPVLQTEVFYDKNNLRIRENLLIRKQDKSTYIMTRIYERDENGNILKIISKSGNEINNIEIHKHKK